MRSKRQCKALEDLIKSKNHNHAEELNFERNPYVEPIPSYDPARRLMNGKKTLIEEIMYDADDRRVRFERSHAHADDKKLQTLQYLYKILDKEWKKPANKVDYVSIICNTMNHSAFHRDHIIFAFHQLFDISLDATVSIGNKDKILYALSQALLRKFEISV